MVRPYSPDLDCPWHPPCQLKALRKDLENAYGTVVDLIAIHSYCQPYHAAYADLLKTVNTLRGRYKG